MSHTDEVVDLMAENASLRADKAMMLEALKHYALPWPWKDGEVASAAIARATEGK